MFCLSSTFSRVVLGSLRHGVLTAQVGAIGMRAGFNLEACSSIASGPSADTLMLTSLPLHPSPLPQQPSPSRQSRSSLRLSQVRHPPWLPGSLL
jgi:hypothetical protein